MRAPGAVNYPAFSMGPDGMAPEPGFLESVQGAFPDAAAQEFFVTCRSGGRSAKACIMLAGAGYTVQNVEGGMNAWTTGGLPTETD
mmetsp:Transcript_45236/g.141768  ORF Transcript_45236/g.141768 Transcript_45236/m.141768 type:complete len:86 (+) Transcript_45236:417-674(+)